LDAQREAVASYVGDSDTVLCEYVEVESGKNDDRPKLKAALDHAKITGSTLIIAKLDRLSRDAHFLLGLQKAGVRFVAADMPQATDFTVGIMALVAQQERQMISDRTKAALKAAKARGVALGNPDGSQAFGGDGREKAAEVIQANASDRAEALRQTVENIQQAGITSARGIAAELNRLSIRTPRGGQWHAASVQRLLKRLEAGD
jgi:DNA invertase Pin-like site-specific DNA recombinase